MRLGSGFDNVVKWKNTKIPHALPLVSKFIFFLQFYQILVWTKISSRDSLRITVNYKDTPISTANKSIGFDPKAINLVYDIGQKYR